MEEPMTESDRAVVKKSLGTERDLSECVHVPKANNSLSTELGIETTLKGINPVLLLFQNPARTK